MKTSVQINFSIEDLLNISNLLFLRKSTNDKKLYSICFTFFLSRESFPFPSVATLWKMGCYARKWKWS